MSYKQKYYETLARLEKATRANVSKSVEVRPFKRPKSISIMWIDPLDGELCSGCFGMLYTVKRSLRGYYRKHAIALKEMAKKWTGPRQPKLIVEYR